MSAFFPVTQAAIGSKPGKMSCYAGVAILRPSAGTKTYGLFRADSLNGRVLDCRLSRPRVA